MASHINHNEVKIIEQCQVAPPQGSIPSAILPLTFFDIGWFLCPHVKRIFFYEFPYPINHSLESALPTLKHPLSLTLQHFFPFASNLIVPPYPYVPFIRYHHGDSLSFVVAESKVDFTLLVSDSPQDIRDWHPLVPSLPPHVTLQDGTRVTPLMAIQVTILPNAGFAICLTFNHIAADGKSLHHFMKFWANVCKQIIRGGSDLDSFIEGSNLYLPFHDRDIVKDPKGLKHVYLEELRALAPESMKFQDEGLVRDVPTNMVRATIVLSRDQVEKLKKWARLKYCDTYGSGTLLHMSTFVVTCSLIWVCMIESEEQSQGNNNCVTTVESDELCCLIFRADCRGRPEFSIPLTYFGNCLVSGIVALKRGELVGENGIVEAASAIERDVRDLRSDALERAENFMSIKNYRELRKGRKLVVAGSSKLAVYETDFGWGKPKKSGAVHVESEGAFSLSDSRDKEGAIEVGFALERIRMNTFIDIFEEHLDNIDHSLSMYLLH